MSIWDNGCIDLRTHNWPGLVTPACNSNTQISASSIYIVAPGQSGLHSLTPSQRKKKWGKEKEEKEITVLFVVNEDFNCLATAQKTRSYVWSDNWWLRCLENQYGFTGIILMCKLQEEYTKLAVYYKRPEVLSKLSELRRTQMFWIVCPFPGCLRIPAVTGGETTDRQISVLSSAEKKNRRKCINSIVLQIFWENSLILGHRPSEIFPKLWDDLMKELRVHRSCVPCISSSIKWGCFI